MGAEERPTAFVSSLASTTLAREKITMSLPNRISSMSYTILVGNRAPVLTQHVNPTFASSTLARSEIRSTQKSCKAEEDHDSYYDGDKLSNSKSPHRQLTR